MNAAVVQSHRERHASDCRICPDPSDLPDEIEIAHCRLQREVETGFQRRTIECKWQAAWGSPQRRRERLERFRETFKIRSIARVADIEITRDSRRAVEYQRDGADNDEVDVVLFQRVENRPIVGNHRARIPSRESAARRIVSSRMVGVIDRLSATSV